MLVSAMCCSCEGDVKNRTVPHLLVDSLSFSPYTDFRNASPQNDRAATCSGSVARVEAHGQLGESATASERLRLGMTNYAIGLIHTVVGKDLNPHSFQRAGASESSRVLQAGFPKAAFAP